jgi:hypothetical protein
MTTTASGTPSLPGRSAQRVIEGLGAQDVPAPHRPAFRAAAMARAVMQPVLGRINGTGMDDVFGVPGDHAFTVHGAIVHYPAINGPAAGLGLACGLGTAGVQVSVVNCDPGDQAGAPRTWPARTREEHGSTGSPAGWLATRLAQEE